MANFDLSKLAQALKNVGDAGAALIQDCTARAKDGKVDADIEPLKLALGSIWQEIAPRDGATDTDPTLEREEKKLKGGSQEIATGDRSRANDSRYDTRFTVAEIFSGKHVDDEATSLITPSVNDIFSGKPTLAEG